MLWSIVFGKSLAVISILENFRKYFALEYLNRLTLYLLNYSEFFKANSVLW